MNNEIPFGFIAIGGISMNGLICVWHPSTFHNHYVR